MAGKIGPSLRMYRRYKTVISQFEREPHRLVYRDFAWALRSELNRAFRGVSSDSLDTPTATPSSSSAPLLPESSIDHCVRVRDMGECARMLSSLEHLCRSTHMHKHTLRTPLTVGMHALSVQQLEQYILLEKQANTRKTFLQRIGLGRFSRRRHTDELSETQGSVRNVAALDFTDVTRRDADK